MRLLIFLLIGLFSLGCSQTCEPKIIKVKEYPKINIKKVKEVKDLEFYYIRKNGKVTIPNDDFNKLISNYRKLRYNYKILQSIINQLNKKEKAHDTK
jgi:hypothetical protein